MASINDPGKPGTIQRLIYDIPRARTSDDWRLVHKLAGEVLEQESNLCGDTTLTLLLNALCTATQKVRDMQNGIEHMLKEIDHGR